MTLPMEMAIPAGDAFGPQIVACSLENRKKETLATLGYYPSMTLAEARVARNAHRGARHAVAPPPEPAGPTLSEIAARWHAARAPLWKPHHAVDVLASLKREIFEARGGDSRRHSRGDSGRKRGDSRHRVGRQAH